MNSDNKKHIIKKLIREELNTEEEMTLLRSHPVENEMTRQWNDAPDMSFKDNVDGNLILKKIQRKAWFRLSVEKARFYRIYSWVASVILLIGFTGSFMYMLNTQEPASIYVVTAGIRSIETVDLPDGTSVQLGPGSTLTYPAAFTKKTREVKLDGQAFFDIHANPSKPFIVRTNSMDVEALGTAFELFCHKMNNASEAILLNGKIKVKLHVSGPDEQSGVILEPNEKIEYIKDDNRVVRSVVNADSYTSWRVRGIMSFEHEKLSVIIPRLEQWYGRKINCPKEIADYKFTFKIRDEDLERILYIMGESSPVRYIRTEEGDYSLYLAK